MIKSDLQPRILYYRMVKTHDRAALPCTAVEIRVSLHTDLQHVLAPPSALLNY